MFHALLQPVGFNTGLSLQRPTEGRGSVGALGEGAHARIPRGRGLHSSTFRLNVSAFSGMGDAFRDCFGGCAGVCRRCLGCILCQKRLKLS
jgi:hypothetical protein